MRKKQRVLLIFVIGILAFALLWQFAPPPPLPPLPNNFQAETAVWLDITWVMDRHTDAQIEILAQTLQTQGVDYVFAYVSYLKAGDVFNPTFDYAAQFTQRFRMAAPQITLLAWVGVPIFLNGDNRLANASIRASIAQFAADTVIEMGFDGFHLNAEPAASDDPTLIATLQEIRTALPKTAMLSTTAHALRLSGFVTWIPYPTLEHHWTTGYLRLVAENADQIALMAYDSGLPFPADYRAWVAFQIRTSAEALADIEVNFLIGMPTSEEWTNSHHLTTEYLVNALYGVRLGLSQTVYPETIDGIAVYPYWETDDAEWDLIDDAFPN